VPGPGPAGKAPAGKAPAETPAGKVAAAAPARPAAAPLQRLGAALGNQATAELLARQAIRQSPGLPLEAGTRAGLEERFGADLSSVRVHDDPAAAAAVGAVAYTVGEDIVLGRQGGRGLLAHEIAHVLQQRDDAGGSAPARRESEAGRAAESGGAPVTVRERGRVGLARQETEFPATTFKFTGKTTLDILVDGVPIFGYDADEGVPVSDVGPRNGGRLVITVTPNGVRSLTFYPDAEAQLRALGYTDVQIKRAPEPDGQGELPLDTSVGPPARPRATRSPRPGAKGNQGAGKPPAAKPPAAKPPATEPPASAPGAVAPAPDLGSAPADQPGAALPALPPPASVPDWLTSALGPAITSPQPTDASPGPGPETPGPGAGGPAAAPPNAAPPAVTGKALVDQFTHWFNLDEEALGARLARHARDGHWDVITSTLDQVGFTDRDDVALAVVSQLTDDELDAMARTPLGRALNQRLSDELMEGFIGLDEFAQARRLQQARDRTAGPPEVAGPDGRTNSQVIAEIEGKTGLRYGDLLLALGQGPVNSSPREVEAVLYAAGILQDDTQEGFLTDPDVEVIDAVWMPDPYREGHFIRVGVVGRASRVAAMKRAGQEEVRLYVLNGLTAGLGALPAPRDLPGRPPPAAPSAAQNAGRSGTPAAGADVPGFIPQQVTGLNLGLAANDEALPLLETGEITLITETDEAANDTVRMAASGDQPRAARGSSRGSGGSRSAALRPGRRPGRSGGFGASTPEEVDIAFDEAKSPEVTGGKRAYIDETRVPTKKRRRLDIGDFQLLPGEKTQRQALTRIRTVFSRLVSETPLGPVWEQARSEVVGKRSLENASRQEMLDLYDKVRNKFWDLARKDPGASKFLSKAGFEFGEGRAPLLRVNKTDIPVQERRISLDHNLEKALGDNYKKAIDADNLTFSFHNPNSNRETVQVKFGLRPTEAGPEQ